MLTLISHIYDIYRLSVYSDLNEWMNEFHYADHLIFEYIVFLYIVLRERERERERKKVRKKERKNTSFVLTDFE